MEIISKAVAYLIGKSFKLWLLENAHKDLSYVVIEAYASIDITLVINAKVIIITGKNCIQNNSK